MVSLKDNLIGSWRLVKCEELPVDGSLATLPLGERPIGYIIYSSDGFFAALLSSAEKGSKAEPIAYAGPYSVDEEARVVHQHADVSAIPGWVGQTHTRRIELEGSKLILSTVIPAVLSGREVNAVITWHRAHG